MLWDGKTEGNKRTAKTKKAILSALFDLMAEKNVEQITITELSARAGVDRKTFYHYYKSVNDVISECEDRLLEIALDFMHRLREDQPDHRMEFFDVFNRMMIENLDFITKLMQTGAMPMFWRKASYAFKAELLKLVNTLDGWTDRDRAILELGCLNLASGTIALYLQWFSDNRGVTLEEVGRVSKAMAVGSLSGLSKVLGRDLDLSHYI